MKILGKELKEFWQSIPDGKYVEGDWEDDPSSLEDDVKYDPSELGYETIENDRYEITEDDDKSEEVVNFITAFKRWKAKQSKVTVILHVDKNCLDSALSAIKDIKGVKIVK